MGLNKKIIIVLTGIAILVAGIICRQHFLLMVPLFVSLFVMSFQSEANRIGSLIGAINALIYTATYTCIGVYVSAASALFMSFPLQLMTFFNWKKHAYKKTVIFKRMSNKMRVAFTALVLGLWAVAAAILYGLSYEYAIFDSILFLLGLVVSVLTMLAYIEYTYLWILQAVIGVFLNVQMVLNDFSQLTYLIYGIYALYCVVLAYKNVHNFYKEQQEVSL